MKTRIDVFEEEKKTAKVLREIFKKNNLTTINVLGSPGSGKTTFIELISKKLGKQNCIVIEGDLSSEIDASKLNKQGIKAIQINTGTGCHLIPKDILKTMKKIVFKNKKYLFIENVGNLVCPANKDLGEKLRVLVLSIPEGSDKPEKYPVIFRFADIVVLSKTDLLKQCGFKKKEFKKRVLKINPKLKIFEFNKTKKNIAGLTELLKCK